MLKELRIQHSTFNIQHSSSSRRVAITGIGIVSPFGRGKTAAFDALRDARSAIRPIGSISAGQVPADAVAPGKFDRFTSLALAASEEAMEQADIAPVAERFGVIVGTGMGGAETLDGGYKRIYADAQRVPPTMIAWSMYNAAASAVSTRFGAKGPAYAVVSACASSAHAIGQAFQAIRSGQADVVLAGGADAPLTFGVIRAWEAMRVLAPDGVCRPFSADRQGLVLAEGGAMFVLESFDEARRRGATLLGEIAGFGITSDAGHITDPSADGAARAMAMALDGLPRDGVGYINAHGTGTRANDPTETAAIKQVFGDAAYRIPVSSTKSQLGHAMGASGAIETACSLLALNGDFLPPTINFTTPDPECDLDYVPNAAREARVALFLSNSFGFGGMNGVLAVRTVHGL
jgi:nodulation protein E